jgi:hypothetical protein
MAQNHRCWGDALPQVSSSAYHMFCRWCLQQQACRRASSLVLMQYACIPLHMCCSLVWCMLVQNMWPTAAAYTSAAAALYACRMYATAAARSDGLLLLCGGRDVHGTPLADAFGFARHRDGRWEWHAAPGSMPAGRYQHGAVFVGTRLHISGGAVGGGRMVSCEAVL